MHRYATRPVIYDTPGGFWVQGSGNEVGNQEKSL